MTFCGPLDGGEASVNCGLFVGDRFAEEVWLFTAGRAQNSLIDVGRGDVKGSKKKKKWGAQFIYLTLLWMLWLLLDTCPILPGCQARRMKR